MTTKTLQQIWDDLKDQGYESDKNSVHSYLPVYENQLEPYRHTALSVLEIGVFKGDSIRLWKEYFTKATIFGIDCDEKPHGGMADLFPFVKEHIFDDRVGIHIFNAEDEQQAKIRFSRIKFDVIIEDAGHHIEQQLNLYNIWKHYLADGGIYIVEDVQDIDNTKDLFLRLDTETTWIVDLRDKKGRYDDVLIVIK